MTTWGTDPVFMSEDGATYFYHNDHLGTPQKMTDADGAVVWSATYSVFGAASVDSASTVTNNLRFPGQYYDDETGLHYNFHRYYDPETGRYLREDPIGLWGGINLYRYTDLSPLSWVDPFGLCPGDKKKCIEKFLQQNYGNFVADTLVPEFSAISLFTNFWDFVKGGAISAAVKGTLVGLPWLASRIAAMTGKNLASYPGMAGAAIGAGVFGVASFSTAADAYARWECRYVQ